MSESRLSEPGDNELRLSESRLSEPSASEPLVSESRASESSAHDAAAHTRTARFGVLPERIAFEDMVQEQPALPANQAVDSFDPGSLATRFSCLAADLGL